MAPHMFPVITTLLGTGQGSINGVILQSILIVIQQTYNKLLYFLLTYLDAAILFMGYFLNEQSD